MACAVIATYLSTGRVLLTLGKVQFELQKLVDHYVSAYCYVVICGTSFDIFLVNTFDLVRSFSFCTSAYSYNLDNYKSIRVSS